MQRYKQFVTLGPNVHHGGFNADYNVAKGTSLADFSWQNVARSEAKNNKLQQPFLQFTISNERIPWKETVYVLECRQKCNETN